MQQRQGQKYESENGFKGNNACNYLNGGSLEIMSALHFLMKFFLNVKNFISGFQISLKIKNCS